MAEFAATGIVAHPTKSTLNDLTIIEMGDLFLNHAKSYYRKPNSTLTQEYYSFKKAIGDLIKLYGELTVNEFGPRKPKAIR